MNRLFVFLFSTVYFQKQRTRRRSCRDFLTAINPFFVVLFIYSKEFIQTGILASSLQAVKGTALPCGCLWSWRNRSISLAVSHSPCARYFFFLLLIRKKPHREFTLTVTENPSRVKFSLEDQISDHTTGLMLLYSYTYDVENWPSTLSFFLSQ